MFISLARTERDYITSFRTYIDSTAIIEEDRAILEQLMLYVAPEAINHYSSAFTSSRYDGSLNENTNLIPAGSLNDFWHLHKKCVENILEPINYCPVCGISYNSEFNYVRTIEHVLPKSKYHQYILSPINLVYFCGVCNSYKGDIVNEEVFHPYFSRITCTSETRISFFKRSDDKIDIKIIIEENNDVYKQMIKKIFKLHLNYQKFIRQVINKEISSIELVIWQRIKGLDDSKKLEEIKDYIRDSYLFNSELYYAKTETEYRLLEQLKQEIEQNYEKFAQYILENLTMN